MADRIRTGCTRIITPDAALSALVVTKALAWAAAINTPEELQARVALLLATKQLEGHRS